MMREDSKVLKSELLNKQMMLYCTLNMDPCGDRVSCPVKL